MLEDSDSVADLHQFFLLRRHDDDASTLVGKTSDDVLDVRLGANVHPLGGFI